MDGSVSKVFLGDDAIKVTLNKKNPNDPNEKIKKVHVRNFTDLDKLRKDVKSKNYRVPTRTFYNSEYWKQRNNLPAIKRGREDMDVQDTSTSLINKKKKFDSQDDDIASNISDIEMQNSHESSFTSASENDQ